MVCTGLIVGADQHILEIESLEALSNLNIGSNPALRIWVDIESEDDTELSQIAKIFGLHELTVEDCLTPGHFPKIEDYGSYLFMIFRGLKSWAEVEEVWESVDLKEENRAEEHELFSRKVAIYLSQTFIITYRRREVAWLDALMRQMKQDPMRLLTSGTDQVAHRVIDVLIDRVMRGVGFFDKVMDDFEDKALGYSESLDVAELLELKRDISALRNVMRIQRAVISRLAHDPGFIRERTKRRYFKDIDDHALTVLSSLDKHIEAALSIRDTYLAMSNVRLGDTMRVLTVITTIAAPLNIVVGLYGMNFEAIPLLHNKNGFWFIVWLMLAVGVGMLLYFRRKRWI